ncbi:CPBP family intramembrane glutamic endopeptidase [Halocatena marina]|uniref:CPBP family intramembrane glutamic endopeptidase n=1 Tax=Halocatena marina TaxID=2934937 RepID=UPI002225680D|nr:type II CAAX endopeptidase family protein [Halocatena marina]
MPEKRSHELGSAGGSTKTVRHDLPYQRAGSIDSETKRHLGWFAVVVVALPTLVAVPALLGVLDSAVLGMLTPVMAWIPTFILFGLHRLYRRDESFLTLAAIKPIRPVRPIIVTSLFVMVALCVLPVLTEALAILFGLKSVAVSSDAWALLPTVPLFVLAYVVLAAGEEFAWRGYIQTLLAPWGYWSSSAAIGAFWSLWHIPFSIVYVTSGDMLVRDLVSTSVNLFLAAFVLSGVRYLSASVWPAVVGHSLFNTVLVFVYSNFTTTIGSSADMTFWAYTGMSWLVWLVLIAITAQAVRRRTQPTP